MTKLREGSILRRIVDEVRAGVACGYLLCEYRGKVPPELLPNRDYDRVAQAVQSEVQIVVQRVVPLIGAAAASGAGQTLSRLVERGLIETPSDELVTELVNRASMAVLDGSACVTEHLVHDQPEARQ